MLAPLGLGSRLRDGGRRRMLLGAGVAAGVLSLAVSAPARAADPFGQVDRFVVTPSPSYAFSERTVAFGVDPEEGNAVYVGEEAPPKGASTEPSGEFQIQKYDPATHKLLAASATFTPNPKAQGAQAIEGVAVDHGQGRIYVLALALRLKEPDEEEAAAGTLYAFKTSTLESAVSGPGEEEKAGVLANAKVLKAQGKIPGEALLNPTGVAVDPTTHEIVMLGEVHPEGLQRYLAVQRVSSAGVLGGRYVDPLPAPEFEEANSPVVSPGGTLFAQRNTEANEEQMIRIPTLEGGAPTTIFHFNLSEPSSPIEELVNFDPALERKGAGLALVPGSEAKTGKLWSESDILEPQPGAEEKTSPHPGALAVEYKEAGGASVSTSEVGWTGGRSEQSGPSEPCTIAEGTLHALGPIYPLLAAGGEGKVFLLSSKTSEVIELGPGGSGCPHTSVAPIVASAGTGPTSEVPLGTELAVSSEVVMGNVLSAEWSFGDGPFEKEIPFEYQRTEATHVYKQPGTFTIAEKIKSDDLASPEVGAERTISVKAPARVEPPSTQSSSSPPPPTPAPSSGVLAATFSYRVGLASTSLGVAANGAVVIKVACLGTSACIGRVTLRTLSAVSATAGARKSLLTLASGSFNLAPGQTKALTLHLSSKARKLLARTHVLRARATIVARDSSGLTHTTPVTVTLRERRHR
jgi:hypothetical protein